MGCLVFGMSKSEIRKLSIIDLVGPTHKELIKAKIPATKNKIFLCGEILPISKYNGQTGYCSFWAKCHDAGIITWVIEEVVFNTATLGVDLKTGQVIRKDDKNNLFPAIDEKISVHDIISGLPSDLSTANGLEHHVTISDGEILPCFINMTCSNDLSIEIVTLPHIAGVMLLNPDTYHIEDYNTHFFSNLFGYSANEDCRGWSIDDIIPSFTWYMEQITETMPGTKSNGLVLPEHLFRKMASQHESVESGADATMHFLKSKGIEGLHKDSHLITIDVRAIRGSSLALWVTYSRDTKGARSASLPSQLTLLSMKKKMHRPSVSRGESPMFSDSSASPGSPASPVWPTSISAPSTISQPLSGISKESSQRLNDILQVPRENIVRPASEASTPVSLQYSAHIQKIGALRRKKALTDFNILQKMGEGSYGKVLLAEYKTEPHLKVVLKCVIKERIMVHSWTRDRKLGTIPSEIKIMATLNEGQHKNIMHLLDFFEDDEFYHIEMEPHGNPATDLFDLIELQPRMPESQCRELFRQVVSAVCHMHSMEIVHRDLKDENMIVDGFGLVKVIDFGSAAFVRQGPFDMFVGTVDYAAPEVLAGKPYSGKPQDVWALGILLYTIVYKENPFHNVDEIMGKEGQEMRIPFTVSEECIDLVKRILNRDVDQRLTIEEVWEHPWMQTIGSG